MSTITDRLGRTLAIGDKVAYQSFKIDGMAYGEIISLARTRATVSSIKVHVEGITDNREAGVTEPVTGYNIIKV